MSTHVPSAPPTENHPIGFITHSSNNLPQQNVPPPYHAVNNPPYPKNSQPFHQPYAVNSPMNQNVYTTQPIPNTIIIRELKLTSEPVTTTCPKCQTNIMTRVEYKSGMRTHGAALLLCALDADCCACLPYCCDQAKDAHHYCPKCGHYFGKHEPSL